MGDIVDLKPVSLSGLPHGAPDVRRLAANAIFDGEELADAAYRLGRDRRSGRDM